jgi:hypothetical protein
MKRTIAATALVLVAGFGLSARADDDKIAPDKLPKVVLKAINAKFPGAKLEEAAKEVEEGKTSYEVEFTFKDGEYTVSVTADGTIEEIEREIAIKELPVAVFAALKAKYPKAKLDEAEEVTAGEKVTYEVIVKPKGKKAREVVFSTKGLILKDAKVADDEKEGDDEDDDDDDDKDGKKEKKDKKDKDEDKAGKKDKDEDKAGKKEKDEDKGGKKEKKDKDDDK